MKTILLISPYWKEKHRWMVSSVKLAELWQRLGYRVTVLCMGAAEGQKGKWNREEVSPTLTIYRMKDFFLKDPWNYGIALGFSGKALKLARELKPEVIVVNKILFWSSFSLLRLKISGYKVLLLSDALVGITWWPRGRVAKICSAIYAWTLGWLILKAANRIVFFHPQPLPLLHRLGIAEKSIVIPTGIDLASFPLTPVPSPDGRGEKGVREVTATYIGRLESVKGADDFVAAAVKAKQNHPELNIQVVGWYPSTSSHSTGSGRAGQANHPLVKKYSDRVTFTGLRHDIAEILASSDIFVLPSYSEGLSNALMEAMASGCACIVTAVGGNTFLIPSGVYGLLFEPGDRAALAAHISRLVEDPAKRHSLGEAARKRIEEKFSWDKVGEEYRKLFENWAAVTNPSV